MTNPELRKLAILLLDDENGINEEAYNELSAHLSKEAVNEDITNAVVSQDSRFFLNEDHGLVALEQLMEKTE